MIQNTLILLYVLVRSIKKAEEEKESLNLVMLSHDIS